MFNWLENSFIWKASQSPYLTVWCTLLMNCVTRKKRTSTSFKQSLLSFAEQLYQTLSSHPSIWGFTVLTGNMKSHDAVGWENVFFSSHKWTNAGNFKTRIIQMKENPCFLRKCPLGSAQSEVTGLDLMPNPGTRLAATFMLRLTEHFPCVAGSVLSVLLRSLQLTHSTTASGMHYHHLHFREWER